MQDPINILIVDDEPKNLTVLETLLDDPAYRLVRAESADQAPPTSGDVAAESMQRLAAPVPTPRLHLIRFGVRISSLREVSRCPLREHGVLAPNAKLRALVGR